MDLGKESKSGLKPRLQLTAQATTGATSLEAVHVPRPMPSQQQSWMWAMAYPVFPDLQVWLGFFKKLTYGVAINTTQQEFSENSRLLSQTRPDADASGGLGNQLEVYRMLSESAGGFILHLSSVQDPWFAAQTSPHISQLPEFTSHTLNIP